MTVQFKPGVAPHEQEFRETVARHGFEIVADSMAIHSTRGAAEWHFIATARNKRPHASMTELAHAMGSNELVESFQLSHCRN